MKFSSQCLHCPSISWQNYPWFFLIEGSCENGHPIRAFIVSNIHSCLRFLEAFSMCCVVLAWESHWSWPTWPVNLTHPLSLPLSDFCGLGFWDKICRCLCLLDIPWNAKFLGTVKPGSLKCQWKAEFLTITSHDSKFCFMRCFRSTLRLQGTMQCTVEITSLLVVWGPVCLFASPKCWILLRLDGCALSCTWQCCCALQGPPGTFGHS